MAHKPIDGVSNAPDADLPARELEMPVPLTPPNPARADASPAPAPRLPWSTPQLATHESLTVLTQHFFGPAGVAFALQIGCGVSNGKFGC